MTISVPVNLVLVDKLTKEKIMDQPVGTRTLSEGDYIDIILEVIAEPGTGKIYIPISITE